MKLQFALSKQAFKPQKSEFSLISFFKDTVVLITSVFCVQAVFM